jgi:iron transport multicopper oxidase
MTEPDIRIEVDVIMNNLLNGYNYAFFNNITYTPPKVPTLYTVMSAGNLSTDATVYGEYTHPYVLGHNDIVEIVINNQDSGKHPFHLHGHTFQCIWRSPAYDDDNMVSFEDETNVTFPAKPVRRDTLVINPNGNFVIRFRANNPGVWLFHCHIEWHMMQGLAMTFIEAPLQLQDQSVPANHYDACKAVGMAFEGNAAGNKDLLNLAGQNTQEPWLPAGFTARGIVALVFSCVAAFLGMFSIIWYGMSDLSLAERKMMEHAGVEGASEIDSDQISNHNGRDDD